MRNSGIVIEKVTMEEMQKSDEPGVAATEEVENEEMEAEEEQCVEVEQVEAVCLHYVLLSVRLFFLFYRKYPGCYESHVITLGTSFSVSTLLILVYNVSA